jgi:hypothetical protein
MISETYLKDRLKHLDNLLSKLGKTVIKNNHPNDYQQRIQDFENERESIRIELDGLNNIPELYPASLKHG